MKFDMKGLVRVAMDVRESFEDVCFLRQVHRYEDANDNIPLERREAYRRDAERFPGVMRGMAECTWERKGSRLAQRV